MSQNGVELSPEQRRYQKKIKEWTRLGFDTEGLEELLVTDYDAFLKRKSQVLLGQFKGEPHMDEEEETIEQEEPEPKRKPVPRRKVEIEQDDVSEILVGAPAIEEAPDEEVQQEFDEPMDDSPVSDDEALVPSDEDLVPTGGVLLVGPKLDPKQDRINIKDDGEVVLPPTSSKPEEPVLEETEITIPDENEPEEEDKPKPKKKKKKAEEKEDNDLVLKLPEFGKFRKYVTQRSVIAAIVVVVILIIASYAGWNYLRDNDPEPGPPELKVDVDTIQPSNSIFRQGSSFELEAKITGDHEDLKINYKWTYIEDDIKITDGNTGTKIIKGYFAEYGKNTIFITINYKWKDGSRREFSNSKEFDVRPMVVEVIPEKLDQMARFDTHGKVALRDLNIQYSDDIKIKDIDLDVTTNFDDTSYNPARTVTSVDTEHIDGLGRMNKVFEKKEVYNLLMEGTATASGTSESEFEISGDLQAERSELISYYYNKTVYSSSYSDFRLQLNNPVQFINGEFSSTDRLSVFHDITKPSSTFRLENLRDDKTFISNMEPGFQTFGETYYTYDVKGVELINVTGMIDQPTIKLKIIIDDGTMDRSGLEAFFMELWIASSYSVPVQSRIYFIRDNEDGSQVEVDLYQTLVQYVGDGLAIVYGLDANKPKGNFSTYADQPGNQEFADEFTTWDTVPAMGKMSSSISEYTPETALAQIQSGDTSTAWDNYVEYREDVFLINGALTKDTSQQLSWDMMFGQKGDSEYFSATVTAPKPGVDGTETGGTENVDAVGFGPSELGSLLTFSGMEGILKDMRTSFSNETLLASACDDIFNNDDNFDLAQFQVGVDSEILMPSLDFTSTTQVPQVDYAFIIKNNPQTEDLNKENGNEIYTIAINAKTGQLVYVWEHAESTDDDLKVPDLF